MNGIIIIIYIASGRIDSKKRQVEWKNEENVFLQEERQPQGQKAIAFVFQLSTSCLITFMSLLITRGKNGEADEKHMNKQY